MNIKNNLKSLSKIALPALATIVMATSCQKGNETPLNEQFQYDLIPAEQVAVISSDFSHPSISFTDYDGDGTLDLVVSNKKTGKVYTSPRSADGSFSEEFAQSYPVASGLPITDVASTRIGDKVFNFFVDSREDLCYQVQDLEHSHVTNNANPLMSVPVQLDGDGNYVNDGMVSSADFNSDAIADFFVAKLDNNRELRNVYSYIGKSLPDGEPMKVYDYNKFPLFQLPQGTKSFAIADLDGDGRLDVAIMNKNNEVKRYDMLKHMAKYD